ncbi:isovaleryl-coA dehydrogenase, putative [Trypanosoma cruzi]|uniref:Isobutyryl-CoA dehydrogenase, mitochondrial n=2 Tax=Trypanosoma cruzi TaxID=5693 RepID=V5B8K6_TRYCR|nr:isovaleryl-coA dehydrogenase, putative [Trypanosoma cruzi]ESS63984.1 isovaleryl-coA dehydrogenase [Trypanosoma cruzi Dm28c]KAF8283982.1 putative isovaleryl-coA dehydrogenase [Trypanosoma cruzi]PBJ72985.1 isovaleryl-coA dehydrogenase [Trypanosoma cruzi cruzi]PWU96213.1 putative isovaleryl-coA dehydrogenase [Trypanosoma cruzi]
MFLGRRVLLPRLGGVPNGAIAARPFASSANSSMDFLFNPTPEHKMLRNTIAKFAAERIEPQARQNDIEMRFNTELMRELGDLGVLGVTVSDEDGGAGMDATASVIVHHEISKCDPGFCLAYLAHSVLFVNNFYNSATREQRERWLPKVLTGEHIGAMCMSEPGAGTDVLGMSTAAKKLGDEKYVLNGCKTWITNGTVADVLLVYAKVDGKITAFVVEKGTPGFTCGTKIDKCGMRSSQMCQLFFDNVELDKTNILGEEGKGMVGMMRNLEIERLTLSAMAIGIADRCVELMTRYASERQAFGKPIWNYGQIQRLIAESYAETEAAKALTYSVSRSVSPTSNNRLGSDAAKLFAAPIAKRVADNTMQVMGGMGYSREMPVERLWRDAKLLEIGGGTIEAHQKNITKDLMKEL